MCVILKNERAVWVEYVMNMSLLNQYIKPFFWKTCSDESFTGTLLRKTIGSFLISLWFKVNYNWIILNNEPTLFEWSFNIVHAIP